MKQNTLISNIANFETKEKETLKNILALHLCNLLFQPEYPMHNCFLKPRNIPYPKSQELSDMTIRYTLADFFIR